MRENRRGILKIILPIYKEYERRLKANGLLDYDDMLILAYKALSIDKNPINSLSRSFIILLSLVNL